MKNVTQMPGTQPKPTLNDMLAAIRETAANMPAQIEYLKLQARARKAKYDALVAEGFTEDQALEIVKSAPPFE